MNLIPAPKFKKSFVRERGFVGLKAAAPRPNVTKGEVRLSGK